MLNLCLKNGKTKWVNRQEARLLQRQGQIVCVLDMEDDDPENPYYCSIRNGFCIADTSFIS